MSKNDLILIFGILIIVVFAIELINNKQKGNLQAEVYYKNDIILTIDLDSKNEYTVNGDLGQVIIETDINKIRVKQENSPLHLCSKQGWVENANIPIVCLPNKIVIEIKSKEKLDAVVG